MPISSNTIKWSILNSTDIVPPDKGVRVDMSWSIAKTASSSDVRRFLANPAAAFDVVDLYINVSGGGGWVTVKRKAAFKFLTASGLQEQITLLMLNESDSQLFGFADSFQVTGVYVEDGTQKGVAQTLADAAKKTTTLITVLVIAVIIVAIAYIVHDVKGFVPEVAS